MQGKIIDKELGLTELLRKIKRVQFLPHGVVNYTLLTKELN